MMKAQFYSHLNVHFNHRVKNRPRVEDVAYSLGISDQQLYKILAGDREIRISEFPRYYKALGNPLEALKWLVEKCNPNLAITEIQQSDKLTGKIEDKNEALIILNGLATQLNQEARKDGRYDEDDREKLKDKYVEIITVASQAIRELVKIGEKLEKQHE